MRSVCYEIKFDFLWSKNFLISTRREFWLEIKFLFREDARNLHMIRNFYLKIRFLRRVNDFFDLQKKAIFTNSFRSVPPSPSHRFLYISGNLYRF